MTAIDNQSAGVTGAFGANQIGARAKVRLPWPVALYVFCVVIPIGFQAGPLYMTSLRLMLLVVTVPLMVQILIGRYGRVNIADIFFTAHIIWAAVALFMNHDPRQATEQIGSVGMEFLGGYAVGRAFIRTPEAFAALCRFLVAIVCVSLPFVLFESQTGRSLVLELLRGLPGVRTHGDFANTAEGMRLGLHRSQFTFAHPIHYGLFCSVVMSLAWVALKGVTSNGWRVASTLIVGICGFLSLSSGALLAIMLQLGLFCWAAVFARVQSRWWILVGLTLLAYITVDLLSNRTPVLVFLSYATFSAHTAYWRVIIFEWGMVNVWANPIFGLGLNDWVRPRWMYSGSMDNFWLVMAVRYGIPGFVLLFAGYLIPILKIVFRDFSNDAAVNQLRLSWTFTFIGITFTLCTVHVWENLYSFIFFLFGAGMWFIRYTPASQNEKTSIASTPSLSLTDGFSRRYLTETPEKHFTHVRSEVIDETDDVLHQNTHREGLPFSRQLLVSKHSREDTDDK